MKVAEYMTTEAEAQVALPSTSLGHIAKQLMGHGSCIIILEGKKPVGKNFEMHLHLHCTGFLIFNHSPFLGIITKTDITRAFAEGVSSEADAESFMPDNLICVKEDTQTDDLADLIQKEHVHHLVVVDNDGNFAGIASSWDVAREVSLDAKAFPYNRELWTTPHSPKVHMQ